MSIHLGKTLFSLLVVFLALSGGCSSRYEAPLIDDSSESRGTVPPVRTTSPAVPGKSGLYIIKPGDTLYSIAWRYNLSYQELARWNGIEPPYRIFAGKTLRLKPTSPSTAQSGQQSRPVTPRSAGSRVSPSSTPSAERAAPPAPTAARRNSPAIPVDSPVRWQWPARGRVQPADSVVGERGINIFGTRGNPVVASAAGRVVYSGSGLVGYGKLIIVEHNSSYLSAYAHNDKLLVSEGATVVGGQKIAEMGSTGAREVMLHFEIRLNGKPVPPLDYLP